MASVFVSQSTGTAAAGTGFVYSHAGSAAAGDLFFVAVSWAGVISGLSWTAGFTKESGLPNVGSSTVQVERFWKILEPSDISGGGNPGIGFNWTTSRRATVASVVYSGLLYSSPVNLLNAKYGNNANSVTTTVAWVGGQIHDYGAKQTREIYTVGSSAQVTYGAITGRTVAVRALQNQVSGPSILIADAAFTLPGNQNLIAPAMSCSQGSATYVTSTHSFRDESVSGAQEDLDLEVGLTIQKRVIFVGGL